MICPRPRGERLLNLRIKQLFGSFPTLHDPEVDPPKRGRALKRLEYPERNTRAASIHRHKQRTAGASVQRTRPFEELNAVHSRQLRIDRHEGHLVALASQLVKSIK